MFSASPTIRPPTAGPIIEAIWKTELFHVTALLKTSGPTICGNKAARDGNPQRLTDRADAEQEIQPAHRDFMPGRDHQAHGSQRGQAQHDHQHAATVEAVGDLASGNRQEQHGHRLDESQPAQRQLVVGHGVDVNPYCHTLNQLPEGHQEPAGSVEPVVGIPPDGIRVVPN